MFWHNFKYSFKTLFKNKMLIFWTLIFPILLGTFFNMAFKDIEKNEQLDIIDIAIVDNEYYNENPFIKESFQSLSDSKNEKQLFHIEYVSLNEAKQLLDDKKISGYLLLLDNKESKVVVKENGIDATVLRFVVDEINQTAKVVENVAQENIKNLPSNEMISTFYKDIYAKVTEMLNEENVPIKDISNNNLSYTMIEFYTLIAMTCLYGGILAMVAMNQNLANMSSKGKRVSITPISKGKIILSSVLASYLIQILGVGLLLLFLYFILKIDFGNHLFFVILLSLIGSLSGLSLGIFVATILKSHENTKTGILIAVTMLGCFLSGMMGITMKYIIDKNIPILNKLNPASMITDGFYSLYYYDTLNRYWFNIASLLLFSGLLIFVSYIILRRQKYDSI